MLGVTKSRIASGGVINRTAKSIHRTDIIGMRRRITQPGCPHLRRIAEGIAAVLTPSGPFFMSTRDDWKQCPLLAQSGHRDRLRAEIASGHERADVTRVT